MSDPEFQPTPNMRRLLAAVLQEDGGFSPAEPWKAAAVRPETYRGWLADRGFGEWMNREVRAHVRSRLWEVRLTHLRMALDGNLQAIKLFYDLFADRSHSNTEDAGDLPTDLASFLMLHEARGELENDPTVESETNSGKSCRREQAGVRPDNRAGADVAG